MWDLILNLSISICDSFRLWWWIIYSWEQTNFIIADIPLPEVLCFFGIGQLHQKSHNVIWASVWGLIPLSKAWIMVFILHVRQSTLWASIIVSSSIIPICVITSEPFLEPHGTHDIIIRHRVETVECALDFLFRSDTSLEGCRHSCVSEPVPIHNLLLLETPRLKQ